MTTIDTSGWIINDNLQSMSNQALNAFVANTPNAYSLFETEFRAFAGSGTTGRQTYVDARWDFHQVPFLRGTVPTFGETSFVTYTSLSHGKSVRPMQHLTWTGPQGQHMHMVPVIDSVQGRWQGLSSNVGTSDDNRTLRSLRFNMRFYYGSLSTNYSFPNFNDAAPEFDIWLFNAANNQQYLKVLNFPISTTGAGSAIVLSTTAPSGNFMRRDNYGVVDVEVHGTAHIPSSSQMEAVGGFGRWHFSTGFDGLPQKLIVAVRMHSQTAPYVRYPNVPRITNPEMILSQAGIYAPAEDHVVEEVEEDLRLGGNVVVRLVNYVPVNHSVSVTDRVRLSGDALVSFEDNEVIEQRVDDDIRLRAGSVSVDHDRSGIQNYSVTPIDSMGFVSSLVGDLARAYAVSPVGRIRIEGDVEGDDIDAFGIRIADELWVSTHIFTSKDFDEESVEVIGVMALQSSVAIQTTAKPVDNEVIGAGGGGGFIPVILLRNAGLG